MQIAHDKDTISEVYEGCYMQTEDEIHSIMDGQIGAENVNIGLANTNVIADMIDDVNMPFQGPKLPKFPLSDGFNNNYEYLQHLIKEGWYQRGFDKFDDETKKIYRKRLEYELDVIHSMGFDGYFLIIWDFLNFAKSHDIMVAPGRGSGAGSLVCYTIHITDLNPIKYGLIFERFLNPERVSLPDVDSDVSDRGTIINYLINKYGENNVCQIINFNFMTPALAIQDVGRILGFKYTEMQQLSQKFSYDTFDECVQHNRKFIDDNPKYTELFDIASKLSGRLKTVSCHAGGVGIVDTDMSDYMAMKIGTEGEHIIQVDKRIIEEIGIIKFDILGVKTLNMIKEIQTDIGADEYDLNINNPVFEADTRSYDLLGKALTNGVFQVESAGMKDLLLRLKPDSLGDLAAVLALYRPDSMGALEEYIECKHDPSKVKYIHPDMEPILKETYGCMIYQEQLLDIVRKFGGRSYGGADLFRKGIAKKNVDLVKAEADKLYKEIINNGYDKNIARTISNDLSQKGGYLFNKSHAYSYAIICFQTAYLKTYYPVQFFKALFNLNKNKVGMLNKYMLDAVPFNVSILPPNINKSQINFSVDNNAVRFGLSGIKAIGKDFASTIIEARGKGFKSFNDFIERVNPKKDQVIALIKAGALPVKNKRKALIGYLNSLYTPSQFVPVTTLPTYKKLSEEWGIDAEQYRIGTKKYDYDKAKLLDAYNEKKREKFNVQQKEKYQAYADANKKYLENQEFWEFETLQIFISGNPFDKAYDYIKPFDSVPNGDECVIVGVIAKVIKKKNRRKNPFAFINIYSSFGLVEGRVWSNVLKQYEDLVKGGTQVALVVDKENNDSVVVRKMKPYSEWLEQMRKRGAKI